MKANRSLLFGVLLACSGGASGQGSVVFGGGPSFSTVRTDYEPYKDATEFATGVNFGAGFRIPVGERVRLQACLMAEQKGFILKSDIAYIGGYDITIYQVDVRFKYNYISLPVSAQINTRGTTYGLAKLGLTPALLNTATARRSPLIDPYTGAELIPAEEKDLSADYNQWDLSALAGLGIGHLFGDRWRVELTAEYAHGLLDMGNENILKDYYLLNRSVSLQVCVVYELKSRSKGASSEGK